MVICVSREKEISQKNIEIIPESEECPKLDCNGNDEKIWTKYRYLEES